MVAVSTLHSNPLSAAPGFLFRETKKDLQEKTEIPAKLRKSDL